MRSIIALILSWLKKLFRIADRKNNGPDVPEGPDIERPEPGPGAVISYYGCPNSKDAQKLQLEKKLYR